MHVNPREAVQIHRDVAPRVSIGMHFGTFRLTDEGIDDPRRALEAARAELHVSEAEFRLLDFGESTTV
jgi:L-ascorbate metabolism protein UlaG (beta-lactamase superfamily)